MVRRFGKLILFLGIELIQHEIRHKSHINKLMVLASTYILFFGNDVEAGGRAFLGSLVQAGKMVKAQQDIF